MATFRKSLGWARNATLRADILHIIELPVFLCPAFSRFVHCAPKLFRSLHIISSHEQRQLARLPYSDANLLPKETLEDPIKNSSRLPRQCAGCGAFSQTSDNGEPGYYSLSRRSVKAFLTPGTDLMNTKRASEREIIEASLRNIEDEALKALAFDIPAPAALEQNEPPLCDRCHKLRHHCSGVSIHHPSIESIQDTILESPYKYNHIYHVIDAADFPMSLVPRLHQLLGLTPQRSLNRRSNVGKFYHGRKSELSFIITRSDLLAPLKTQVDSLMPYLVSVLRDALGSIGRDVRLGNVRCVSAMRGWWTKELKEDIWNRGGGGWMVGKVNVGKSQLFESVFPKGRSVSARLGQPLVQTASERHPPPTLNMEASDADESVRTPGHSLMQQGKSAVTDFEDSNLLLPPLQPEVEYPTMPLVSPLPGTTASPIRVPFGNGKGELVDLPGLSRGDLELYVQESHRHSLVMRSRIRPEQLVMKPGQSLLLGGFIRITPRTTDTIILAYSFTPMSSHLTSTEKAIGIQTQRQESAVQNIAIAGVGERIGTAGVFPLKWDVTKQRSGPVTASDAVGIKVEKLPYQVLSTDILIEGCGWVELVAQVRKKVLGLTTTPPLASSGNQFYDSTSAQHCWPEVEVFSPEGRFIAARKPLGAWVLNGQMKSSAGIRGRPRRSMKGMKKKMKALRRMAKA